MNDTGGKGMSMTLEAQLRDYGDHYESALRVIDIVRKGNGGWAAGSTGRPMPVLRR